MTHSGSAPTPSSSRLPRMLDHFTPLFLMFRKISWDFYYWTISSFILFQRRKTMTQKKHTNMPRRMRSLKIHFYINLPFFALVFKSSLELRTALVMQFQKYTKKAFTSITLKAIMKYLLIFIMDLYHSISASKLGLKCAHVQIHMTQKVLVIIVE